jgi:hypothetical protein
MVSPQTDFGQETTQMSLLYFSSICQLFERKSTALSICGMPTSSESRISGPMLSLENQWFSTSTLQLVCGITEVLYLPKGYSAFANRCRHMVGDIFHIARVSSPLRLSFPSACPSPSLVLPLRLSFRSACPPHPASFLPFFFKFAMLIKAKLKIPMNIFQQKP